MNTDADRDLLARNVRSFWRALDRVHDGKSRTLYVSPHSGEVGMRGPDDYLVGAYTRHTPLSDVIGDVEAHLRLKPGALHGAFRLAARTQARRA